MVSTTPAGAFYVSRERFRATLDFKESARNDDQIDLALASATAQVERHLQRTFFPWYGTRRFDWPSGSPSTPWRLWLDADEIIGVSELTSGGVTIPSTGYLLYPDSGPPYNRIEIDLSSRSAFTSSGTYQDSIAVTGVFGYTADTASVGTLAANIDANATSLTLSTSANVGVGDIILIDSEYMVVTGRSQASTGQTLQTPLTASNANVGVVVTNGAAYGVGEALLLDSERMRVVDVAGNTLTVQRAAEGSVLAAHTGSTIYAPRTLTVTRGALASFAGLYPGLLLFPGGDVYPSGDTTAAAHAAATVAVRCVIPGPVAALTMAEAARIYLSNAGGWMTAGNNGGSAPGAQGLLGALADLRAQAVATHGRFARLRAV